MEHDGRAAADIMLERPDTGDAVLLISELESHLELLYPRESRHGLSVERLLAQEVAFFLLRWNGAPAACGGVKLVDADYGELTLPRLKAGDARDRRGMALEVERTPALPDLLYALGLPGL
ncbi:MAG TPA: hypothetical protein VGS80_06950, partial [Ktedonobacterales bacterium]|nr:hypothetical protein [Ktedonobacterales bacterium]